MNKYLIILISLVLVSCADRRVAADYDPDAEEKIILEEDIFFGDDKTTEYGTVGQDVPTLEYDFKFKEPIDPSQYREIDLKDLILKDNPQEWITDPSPIDKALKPEEYITGGTLYE
jgi:hypothetical protein